MYTAHVLPHSANISWYIKSLDLAQCTRLLNSYVFSKTHNKGINVSGQYSDWLSRLHWFLDASQIECSLSAKDKELKREREQKHTTLYYNDQQKH